MAVWREQDHPRDDEGKFTYKGTDTILYGGVEENHNADNEIRPEILGGIYKDDFESEEKLNNTDNKHDIYTQDLIKEVKNTELEVKGIGKVKAEDLIPDIENYIEDNRTKDEKRADIIYPSMKKENPLMTDIKLIFKMFPYFFEQINEELRNKNKKELNYNQLINSAFWSIATRNILNSSKEIRELWSDRKEIKEAINVKKFLDYMQGDKDNPSKEELKRQEALKEMINDYINGGDLSYYAASKIGKIPDAAGLLRIMGKDSNMYTKYTEKAEKYNNSDELPDKFKNIIKEKLESQHLNPNSKGLFFNSDSELAKRIANSPEILDIIKTRKNKIKLYCDYIDSDKIIELKVQNGVTYENDSNLFYSFHKADIHNLKYDAFGNISGDLIDTTDFNSNKNESILVQKARELQDEGKIEPKFVIVHFVIPKSKLNEIYDTQNIMDRKNGHKK